MSPLPEVPREGTCQSHRVQKGGLVAKTGTQRWDREPFPAVPQPWGPHSLWRRWPISRGTRGQRCLGGRGVGLSVTAPPTARRPNAGVLRGPSRHLLSSFSPGVHVVSCPSSHKEHKALPDRQSSLWAGTVQRLGSQVPTAWAGCPAASIRPCGLRGTSVEW